MQYCYHCMETIGTARICPHCGFRLDDYQIKPHHLCPGTLLRGNHYPIGKVLGEGGFGITYVGRNPLSEQKVAIKEFYMNGYVMRDHTVSNDLKTGGDKTAEVFCSNRGKFLDEARRLYKLSHEAGIVRVVDYFEENNTAYIVMDFVEGVTLLKHLERHGKMSGEAVLKLLKPVFDSLAAVHEHGIIHRDISPDNIMLTDDGKVKLLDFGAAREIDATTHSAILKHGYAPFEQYQSKGNQGPWTDVYALCATIYHCITGIKPVEAAERVLDDPLVPPAELDCDCSKTISDALMTGMKIRVQDRYQNIQELRDAIYAKPVEPAAELSVQIPTNDITVYITPATDTIQTDMILPKEEPKGESGVPENNIAVSITPVDDEKQDAPEAAEEQRKEQHIQPVAPVKKLAQNVAIQPKEEPKTPTNNVTPVLSANKKVEDTPGTAEEQYQLGERYYYGDGVKKDYVKAVELFRKAAKQGHINAQYTLGYCYDRGIGVKTDKEQSVEWYQKAAEQGYAEAQYHLGRYYEGTGLKRDKAKAMNWYQKAAEQRHTGAQCRLGNCYKYGIGTLRNKSKAFKWYQEAAERGNASGQFNLGVCYEEGTGVVKDRVKAIEWYRKAAAQGDSFAKKALQKMGISI